MIKIQSLRGRQYLSEHDGSFAFDYQANHQYGSEELFYRSLHNRLNAIMDMLDQLGAISPEEQLNDQKRLANQTGTIQTVMPSL